MLINISLCYSVLTILSIGKKSFENLGRFIKKSGDTARRMLNPASATLLLMQKLAQKMFQDCEVLTLSIDDTLIKKIYSRCMVGSGEFFDTKIGRKIVAYKLMAAMIGNGKYIMPIGCGFMFASELLTSSDRAKTKLDFIKEFVKLAHQLFPNVKIILVADGLFSTEEILKWCVSEGISCEMRMHSNRVVEYQGKKLALSKIESLRPRGRHMARTISVLWHNLNLYVTGERRIDKNGEESIVFLVSTYKAKPHVHVKMYKKRWPIEKAFRTTKQSLGLQECFSTKMETQFDHVCSVFLAYGLLQWKMKQGKFDTPEDVIRALKLKKYTSVLDGFSALDQIFGDVNA